MDLVLTHPESHAKRVGLRLEGRSAFGALGLFNVQGFYVVIPSVTCLRGKGFLSFSVVPFPPPRVRSGFGVFRLRCSRSPRSLRENQTYAVGGPYDPVSTVGEPSRTVGVGVS